jgi:hypothetical protein
LMRLDFVDQSDGQLWTAVEFIGSHLWLACKAYFAGELCHRRNARPGLLALLYNARLLRRRPPSSALRTRKYCNGQHLCPLTYPLPGTLLTRGTRLKGGLHRSGEGHLGGMPVT